MKKNEIPKDWVGPMKACAKMLKEVGVNTRWDSRIVMNTMLWGFQHLLFYKINHPQPEPKKKKIGFKK